MTNVYSVPSKNVYLDINMSEEENDDTILLSIVYDNGIGGGRTEVVRVDPADLARELITASPSFALAIGDHVQKAMMQYFAEDVDVSGDREQAALA